MTLPQSTFVVIAPGMLTTVQDIGRWGHQRYGVSVSGAMDELSHRRANALVGNSETAATLEVTLVGPTLEFTCDARFAICGATFEVDLDQHAISLDTVIHAKRGQMVIFSRRTGGARAYIAIAGGIDVRPVLGSRSTHVRSGLGGFDGRPLRAGDALAVGSFRGNPIRPVPAQKWRRPVVVGGSRIRVLPSVHNNYFDQASRDRLLGTRYTISAVSDRMGYRLENEHLTDRYDCALLSQALPLGAIQVPPSGGVIVAMADRQTVGGYPRIANVISADVPLLGQLGPDDWVSFEPCDIRTAREALMESQREFT